MLEATGIRVTLGWREILRGIDLFARPGEVTAIVGPNGSGKTTLLRALTGEVDHDGQIRLNGQDVDRLRPWQLAAMRAVLPQATALAFPFTVLEVVRLGLAAGLGAARADLPGKALRRVGLPGFEGRLYQQLSGGEKQRVHLARVLVQIWEPVAHGAPRWMFLDEPVSSLDIGHQLQVMQVARDFARAGGGVIAVMHDLNLTAMFASSVALMEQGLITGFGSPDDVLTDAALSRAYDCRLRTNHAPVTGRWILPQGAEAGLS
ncbi:heme ABC transporter ATP-binding protein [Pseudoroseicyclus aestuarii]|uniref:Iron complex transport system ATP-binding protein n=1 Tax=Pseudoroseicyclus aestuarii TaxID=1795041 RepID=A0A318SP06_9RHOB|nr:heme ABC transporter ATP-binding protein [Pseudoroseicyclus aestuarii]PYE81315.1 iron complex transport system ATP-binding protein [Pseudoroseicyclus aestuarii]